MKKINLVRLISLSSYALVIILMPACGGNTSPVAAAVSIAPIIAGPSPKLCENASVGEQCRDRKGYFSITVNASNWGTNGQTMTKYDFSSTLSGNNLLSGGSSWEVLTIGNSSTADVVIFAVPQKKDYDVTFRYLEFGATKPSGSNMGCPNLQQNGIEGCSSLEIMLHFKKGVYPSASSTTINYNTGPFSNGGWVESCS